MLPETQSLEVDLDGQKENMLLVRFVFSDDGFEIIEFVLIYLTKINEKFVEVVKYDFSQREKVHVHFFYPKNPRKVFLDLSPNIDTIFSLKEELELNWHKHLLRFNDKD